MTQATNTQPFFVGFMKKVPKGLGWFLVLAMAGFIGGLGVTSFFVSASIKDPGNGRPRWDLGRQELFGRLEYTPYPVLRVRAEGDKPARAYMLSGLTKVGVIERGRPLEDAMVRADGIMLERGDISMLQIVPNHMGLLDVAEYRTPDYYPAPAVKLGKWKLTGEICDGKCYAGAMRPGRGLAHKACANLCLYDGTPPVFVSEGPVEGRNFFMLADKNGELFNGELSKLTALLLSAEGEVERLDDLMIFRIDLDTVVLH